MYDAKNIFPDLNRLRIESRIELAPTPVERELAVSLLHLYDKGEIEITSDPFTGELMFRSALLN